MVWGFLAEALHRDARIYFVFNKLKEKKIRRNIYKKKLLQDKTHQFVPETDFIYKLT